MSKPNGGPAFPRPATINLHGSILTNEQTGMKLVDYFAGKIAEGDAASGEGWIGEPSDEMIENRARFYYRVARAMIKVREE